MPASTDSQTCPRCGYSCAAGILLCPVCALSDASLDSEECDEIESGVIGSYTLLGEIARGGMGVVYRARQMGLNRIVALKVLPGAAFSSASFRNRFQQEAETAARLKHPGIVAVHEIGQAHGQPFLSMDFIEGASLAERLAEGRITPEFSAQLLREVARAVDHAHRHGVAHRDLKPSNILIDPENRPILTDFGLARFIDAVAQPGQTFDLAGSPPYLPPERVSGLPDTDPVREDVYGLGAVLYHCLTGRPPFAADSLISLLTAVSEGEVVPPRRLNRSVPVDLETICLKCMRTTPSTRYERAAEVADELDRFIRGEPIRARPLTAADHLIRYVRRRPLQASLIITLIVSIAAGTPISLLGWRRAAQNEDAAREIAEKRRIELYSGNLAAATAALEAGNRIQVRHLLNECIPAKGDSDLRGPEWFLLSHLLRPREQSSVPAHSHILTALAWHPSGARILSAAHDGSLRLWQVVDGVFDPKPKDILPPGGGRIHHLRWLRDGRSFLVSEGSKIRCRSLDLPEPLWEIPGSQFSLAEDFRTLAVSTGGAYYFDPPGEVTVWKMATESLKVPTLQRKLPHVARAVAISPDARWLGIGLPHKEHRDDESDLLLEDLHDPGTAPRRMHTAAAVWSLSFSGDSRNLIATTQASDGTFHGFDVESGAERVFPKVRSSRVWSATFTADGSTVLTTSSDRSLRAWPLDGRLPGVLSMAHDNEIWVAAIHPSGGSMVSGDKDGKLKLHSWPLPPDVGVDFPRHAHFRYMRPIFATDGKSLLVCKTQPAWQTVAWQPSDGTTREESHPFHPLGMRPDGTRVYLPPDSDHVELSSSNSLGRRHPIPAETRPADPGRHHSGASTDAGQVYRFSENGQAAVLDVESGALKLAGDFCRSAPLASAISPDGRFLAAATRHELIVHDFSSGRSSRLSNDPHWAKAIVFHPSGHLMATGGADGHIMLRRLPDLSLITILKGHLSEVSGLSISPDGRTLASSEIGSGLRFWRFDTFHEVLRLSLPTACETLTFSPDSLSLAVNICPPATAPTKAEVVVIPCPRDGAE